MVKHMEARKTNQLTTKKKKNKTKTQNIPENFKIAGLQEGLAFFKSHFRQWLQTSE